MNTRINVSFVALMLVVTAALPGGTAGYSAQPAETSASWLVQAVDVASATRLVPAMDGAVTHEPGILRAAGARLTAAQRDRLAGMQGVLQLYGNSPLRFDALANRSASEPLGTNHWVALK